MDIIQFDQFLEKLKNEIEEIFVSDALLNQIHITMNKTIDGGTFCIIYNKIYIGIRIDISFNSKSTIRFYDDLMIRAKINVIKQLLKLIIKKNYLKF